MKKLIIMLVAMLGIYTCDAAGHKAKNVPDDVLKSFSTQYPQVCGEKWKMENNTWVALFKEDKRRDFAYYAPGGSWIKTDTKIPWNKDMPGVVEYGFGQTPFKSWYVDNMKERESPSDKGLYIIQVHKDCGPDGAVPGDCENTYTLYFDANGALLREKQVK